MRNILYLQHSKPAISACPNLSLKAIYSRSLNSARATASCIPSDGNDATPKPDLYANDAGPGYTYSDLLGRQDIQAVVVCLPIMDGPQFIEEALTAGKHVLAEKPIAPSVERAVKLIEFYEAVRAEKQPHVTFAIAENFRVLPALERAVDESRALGKLTGFRANVFFMLDPSKLNRQSPRHHLYAHMQKAIGFSGQSGAKSQPIKEALSLMQAPTSSPRFELCWAAMPWRASWRILPRCKSFYLPLTRCTPF